jgi:hypothetical protein
LGSYSLPKSYIHVVLGQPKQAGGRPDFVVKGAAVPSQFKFEIVRRADPALTMCLDYLGSAFAHDQITVIKQDVGQTNGQPNDDGTSAETSRQFLQTILVNATDRSVQIARNLIRAAIIGISGNPDFGPQRAAILESDKPDILADLEFDPFDTYDSAKANARLSKYGFCLVLEGFTFDRGSLSVDQYCSSPSRARDHLPRIAELYAIKSREPIPPNTPGVLYRPRQTFLISVYRRDDPGRGRWHLSNRIDVALENLSPVISVGITRAIFARRNSFLSFTDGTLTSVCIAKSSEIENFVAIPFEVARSIVALPAQIVQVRINRIAKEEELARVEDQFIRTQAALLQTQLDQKQRTVDSVDTTPAKTTTVIDPAFQKGAYTGLAADANSFTIADPDLQKQQQDIITKLCNKNTDILVDLPPEAN